MTTISQDGFMIDGVNYRQQKRKCGKQTCKCNENGGHGPYWYAFGIGYASSGKYVGKDLPTSITEHLRLRSKAKGKIATLRASVEKRRQTHYKELRRAEDELRALGAVQSGNDIDPIALKALGLDELIFKGLGK